jgi:peptide/nickel transport system substrate-binding protein
VNAYRKLALLSLTFALVATSAGCSGISSSNQTIVLGQKSGIQRLDPASIFAAQDQEPVFQAFGSLFNTMPGELNLQPDLAESGEFISPKEFRVVVRSGLKFSNGNTLDASDVKHSIDRMKVIDDANGPQILLQYIEEVQLVDSQTLVFKLTNDNDQTFPYVLSSVATVVVDEQVFPIDRLLTPEEIISGNPFSGPYVVDSFDPDSLVSYKSNPNFSGIWGKPKNDAVLSRYYVDSNNLALDAKTGQLDVAFVYRSLAPSAIKDALAGGKLKFVDTEGSVPVMLSFRLDIQPYGTKADNADEDKARAIRQAAAHLIDRDVLSEVAYGGSLTPAYSIIPKGLVGNSEILKEKYGDGSGKPSLEKAQQTLRAAGINEKVTLRLLYPPDRYGSMAEVLVNQVNDQLEKDGLFELKLSTAEWSAYREIRTNEDPGHDLFLLQWGPDFGDSDNYLSPLFGPDGWLATGFDNATVNELIKRQLSAADPVERAAVIGQIEDVLTDELPAIVIGMDGRSALVRDGVSGVEDILDVTFKVRYGFITKG